MPKRPATTAEAVKEFKFSNYKVENLNDLIILTKNYIDYLEMHPCKKKNNKNRIANLPLILPDLENLQKLIGLEKLKTQLMQQILYYLGNNESMLMNTVIYGPPGCGKTTVAKIMASIYSKLGILKTNKFKMISRADLVGQYLGETTLKTLKTLESAKDGVIFIDEAYSLGSESTHSTDSYSKEAIDTINFYLLENKDRIICIIAGYKDELEKCFFSKNIGLKRRFPWQFTINEYSNQNMTDIFYSKLITWKLDSEIKKDFILDLFVKNKKYFTNNGGDIDILLQFAKIKQTSRHLGIENNKIFTKDDLLFALKELISTREIKENNTYSLMYL